MHKKRILVAPLNWGLGHATRCIPIINELICQGFEPVIASDGDALKLLLKEFPGLEYCELPAYNIQYSTKESFFKWKLLLQTPKIIAVIQREKEATKSFVNTHNISGIISDNRWGVRDQTIPSVFITHQLKVLSESTTFFSSKIQQRLISKFTECWVPDFEGSPNLSGDMGHLKLSTFPIKYIGPQSRFSENPLPIKYKYTIVLSGPEPQRGILENKLLQEFKNYPFPVMLIRGVPEKECTSSSIGNITIYNFLFGKKLDEVLNSSEVIISRSGYTSIMDIAKLKKKAFLIPTPGQPEQEYLAKNLAENNIVSSCSQSDFSLQKLDPLENTKGLSFNFLNSSNLISAIALFHRK